jgi:hypothetical protein
VPATLYLLRARSKMLAAVPVFLIAPHAFLDPEGRHWSWPEQVLGSSYVLVGLAFLIVSVRTPLPARVRPSRTPTHESGTPAG